MKKLNLNEERASRRPTILEGISKNLTYTEIAVQLGVKRWTVNSDIRKMQYNRDPELKQVYQKRDELTQANKQKSAQKQETRFIRMMGMSIDEKMFQNMISFYKPELKKVIGSKNESKALSKLSSNIRKTLKRNNIITQGWGNYDITPKARKFLLSNKP